MALSSGEEDKVEETPEIFQKIQNDDLTGLQEILKSGTVNVDIEDTNGITPLLHAAYKGNREMTQLLLDQGADVSGGHHDHGYTALHFAALSGKKDVCSLLLEAGAKVYATNTVGRTASQMAAFVGNHDCVAIINNYVPKEDVEYYTTIHGLEKEPKLPPFLSGPVHKLIMQVNISPVKVSQTIGRSGCLLENLVPVYKVLELMSEREMKQTGEVNEVLSFKYHMLQFILREIEHERQEGEKRAARDIGRHLCPCPGKKVNVIDAFIKRLLKEREGDNVQEYQENFLREAVRGFPFRECTLFQQLVANFARIKVGEGTPAVILIGQAINGQRGFLDENICLTCGEEKAPKKCSKCKTAQYCDKDCQKLHWFIHKKVCDEMAEEYREKAKKLAEQKEKEEAEKQKEAENQKKEVKNNEDVLCASEEGRNVTNSSVDNHLLQNEESTGEKKEENIHELQEKTEIENKNIHLIDEKKKEENVNKLEEKIQTGNQNKNIELIEGNKKEETSPKLEEKEEDGNKNIVQLTDEKKKEENIQRIEENREVGNYDNKEIKKEHEINGSENISEKELKTRTADEKENTEREKIVVADMK